MYRAYQNVYSFCKYIRDVLDLLKSYLNILFFCRDWDKLLLEKAKSYRYFSFSKHFSKVKIIIGISEDDKTYLLGTKCFGDHVKCLNYLLILLWFPACYYISTVYYTCNIIHDYIIKMYFLLLLKLADWQ